MHFIRTLTLRFASIWGGKSRSGGATNETTHPENAYNRDRVWAKFEFFGHFRIRTPSFNRNYLVLIKESVNKIPGKETVHQTPDDGFLGTFFHQNWRNTRWTWVGLPHTSRCVTV